MSEMESALKQREVLLFGLDEVGRGPLAGPVVSCCSCFYGKTKDLKNIIEATGPLGIGDSKKLTPKKRQNILSSLEVDILDLSFGKCYKIDTCAGNLSFSLAKVEHHEIDKINILQASLKSMDMAFHSLRKGILKNHSSHQKLPMIWVDGNKLPAEISTFSKSQAVIKGDSKSFLISLASIIAKEVRDNLMISYSKQFPGYGFEKHSGYPTQKHKAALKILGPSPIHRLSFKGVNQ